MDIIRNVVITILIFNRKNRITASYDAKARFFYCMGQR